jgi:hypothetical protein
VELECVDGRAYTHLDGQEVAALDAEATLGEGRSLGDFEQRFTIEAEGGALEVEGLRVDRDLYYVPDDDPRLGADRSGEWVPADHLFMLGDNTEGSSDSRKWKLAAVRLADGTEILYESQDSENAPRTGPDGITRVVDREGVERRWPVADEDPSGRTRELRREPFVPRDLVVGRAFYVFWPLLPGFPGRAGFIH